MELDGSHIRTGILTPLETEEFTPLRRIRRCKRQTDWREVKVGFARPVEQKEKTNFCCQDGSISRSSSTDWWNDFWHQLNLDKLHNDQQLISCC